MKELGLALVEGSTEIPLLEDTISAKFAAVLRDFPNRSAVKTPSGVLTYAELNERSDAFGCGLLDLGVGFGDRVAISLGNGTAYAVISYACWKIGAIVVPLNPAYTPTQVIAALNHISAVCFVLNAEVTLPYKAPKSTAYLLELVLGTSTPRSSGLSDNVPSLKQTILVDNSRESQTRSSSWFRWLFCPGGNNQLRYTATYDQLITDNTSKRLPELSQSGSNDIATIQFTSGTTSAPKAPCLTHRNILNNAHLVGRGMQLTEKDILCCPPPLYHCFGLVLGLLTSMTYGACLIMPSEAFDARAVVKSIIEDKPTVLHGVPTMFLGELDLFAQVFISPASLSHLRTGVIGGSPIPASLRQTLHDRLNLQDLSSCYGLTESSPIICMTLHSDPLERKLNSVGRVLPHTSIKIASPSDPAKTLRLGEKGELYISGYCVMEKYWDDAPRTNEAFFVDEEGKRWLRSGDEGVIGEDNYIQITGRIKDIIIRGGENLYPSEIENVLLQYPGVSNASVIGIADARYGEVIGAFIIKKPGVALEEVDIREWISQRLGRHLIPKFLFWLSEFPLTASGKVEKFKLKDLAARLVEEGKGA